VLYLPNTFYNKLKIFLFYFFLKIQNNRNMAERLICGGATYVPEDGIPGKMNFIFIFETYFNTSWAPRRCPGLFHNFIVKKIDLRTLWALGWGEPPTNKIFIFKPTSRSNFCLLAPTQFSKHTPPFGRVEPAGPRFG
jgi:hypothetical protein